MLPKCSPRVTEKKCRLSKSIDYVGIPDLGDVRKAKHRCFKCLRASFVFFLCTGISDTVWVTRLENEISSPKFLENILPLWKLCINFYKLYIGATFWATFSQTYLVTVPRRFVLQTDSNTAAITRQHCHHFPTLSPEHLNVALHSLFTLC
jgi:hypothetical protein